MDALLAERPSPPETLADDMLTGADEIAAFTGDTPRQTNYHLEKGRLPAFKMGRVWKMRKSTYRAHLERLENAAIQRCSATP